MVPYGHDSILHAINVMGVLSDFFAIVNLQFINQFVCQPPVSANAFSIIQIPNGFFFK